jgi:hypothetical protein
VVFNLDRSEQIHDIVICGNRGIALSTTILTALTYQTYQTCRLWDFEIPLEGETGIELDGSLNPAK